MAKLAFKRVLLKVSGEVLMGSQPFGIDLATVERVAGEVAESLKTGVQLGLVIGVGNFGSHPLDRALIDAERLRPHQDLAGNFQEDALEGKFGHVHPGEIGQDSEGDSIFPPRSRLP